ncbi:ATP-dependent zinc protease [Loktanella sp. D2R18]|uniref:ATP-dependent zinc protease family protein n=1 Tax=Rhodobacterales TaxID=204455 RepID=UPI000DE8875E|nr:MULTISPECIES: RimK/LysX family protein [Rhodobacterales]RBW42330.1 ATP-dependent zinc protease [Loktanella sp. D2R18]
MNQMAEHPHPQKTERPLLIVGWMEYVDLPDLGLVDLKAKIDTGARTSALHARDIDTFMKGDEEWVRFTTHATHGEKDTRLECPVSSKRSIKNTGGVPEERIVIRAKFRIAKRSWTIDLSLADRENMAFGLIVGRTALKNHSIAVHTRRALLTQKRPD